MRGLGGDPPARPVDHGPGVRVFLKVRKFLTTFDPPPRSWA